ncbi:MAG TPA: DUF1918 domain-containing protein [Clostridia bacterium]|nr:DUF1918 domain-containing protein [Clostridia bacterium]
MVGTVGDRIVVESEKVGQAAREGEILEVIEHEAGPEYRVRWDDGHESSLRPHGGSARIFPKVRAKRTKS